MSGLFFTLVRPDLDLDVCRRNRVQAADRANTTLSNPNSRCADSVDWQPADCGTRWSLLLGNSSRIPTYERRCTQYRSSIFYGSDEQKRIAEAYIAQLDKAKVFPRRIVTQVVLLKGFYPAESYHQDYAALHPNNPYIVYNDAPKVAHLREQFPDLYTGK